MCLDADIFLHVIIIFYVKLGILTFYSIIQINARARYSLSFEGACPDLYLPQDTESIKAKTSAENKISSLSQLTKKKWTLYLPKAYHPLLLQNHRHKLQMAMKDLSNSNAVSCSSFTPTFSNDSVGTRHE